MTGERDVRFGVRARSGSDEDAASEPALVERIRREIQASGLLTFARFMELALYEPAIGYYRRKEPAAGRMGDFLTAPEAHTIFGEAVARQIEELWRLIEKPAPFTVREYGAGRGAFIAGIVRGLRVERPQLLEVMRYQPVELNEHRARELRTELLLADAGDSLEPAEGGFEGIVLANEFLDALPVHVVEVRDGVLREVFVDWDASRGRFVERLGIPSTPALAERLEAEGVRIEEGRRGEVCLGIEDWLDEVAADLHRGYVLIVDYGYEAPELYGPRHGAGTLLAYRAHRVSDDPLAAVGYQDLTAHVDFTAVVAAATARGFLHLGTTSQAEFLVGVGAGEILRRAQENPNTTLQDYAALRSALARMLDPKATGGFRVVMLGRAVPLTPLPMGLGFTIRR